jgi:hypothetical protein
MLKEGCFKYIIVEGRAFSIDLVMVLFATTQRNVVCIINAKIKCNWIGCALTTSAEQMKR